MSNLYKSNTGALRSQRLIRKGFRWLVNVSLGMLLGLCLHYQELKDSYDTILPNTFLNLFIEEIFYSTGSAFMKLSLLAFYWPILD